MAFPTATPNYEYTLTDHLGNSRVNFDSSHGGNIATQVDDYYPFGLVVQSSTTSPPNNYLYNKKELQPELTQYDYGARFYDPVVGRWGVIDRYAEKYDSNSPYNYVNNNPIKNRDMNGDTIVNGASKGSGYEQTETALKILKITNPDAYAALQNSTANWTITYETLNKQPEDPDGTVSYGTSKDDGATIPRWSFRSDVQIVGVQKDADGKVQGADLEESENGSRQKISAKDADAKGLIKIASGKIKIDKNLLKGSLKNLVIALGHEFGHAEYDELFKALGYIWGTIDPGNENSRGLGHGKNDPNGKNADTESDKTKAGYDKAKKKVDADPN